MRNQKRQTNPPGPDHDRGQPISSREARNDSILYLRAHKPKSPQTVAVALSGGVDSMVTTMLLKELGHQVMALHMILLPDHQPEPGSQIVQLATRLDVPLHAVDLREAFHQQVIKPFLDAYRKAETPNPCVICNPRIKFSLLQEQAFIRGAQMLATGHYAKLIVAGDGSLRLFRGRDRIKDQSYFLYGLSQEQLARAFFPLGNFLKNEVKQFAAAARMSEYHRPESQEICFIPDNDYRSFLEQYLGPDLPEPGPILDLEGRQLGEHGGIHLYTIGQRRGIGIPSAAPYYVVALEPDTHTVRIGRESDLSRSKMLVTDVNWIATSPPNSKLEALVKIRSRHQEAPAALELVAKGVLVHFHQPQTAITPGQSAVFYRDDEILGGGIIERVIS